jgi:hypothetical protein
MGDRSYFAGMPPSCYQAAASLITESLITLPEPAQTESLIDAAVSSHVPDAGEPERAWVRHLFVCAMNNVALALAHPDRGIVLAYGPNQVELPAAVEAGYWVGCAVLADWDAVTAFFQWIPSQDLRQRLAQQTRDRLGLSEDFLQVLPAPLPLTDAQAGIFGARFAQVTAATMVDGVDDQLVAQWRQTVNGRQFFQAWELPDGRFGVPFTLPVVVASVVAHDYWWPPEGLDVSSDTEFGSWLVDDLKAQKIAISRLEMESAEPYAIEALAEPVADIVANLEHLGGRQVPVATRGFAVGRNDPCPCGSGKKYKKCCGG